MRAIRLDAAGPVETGPLRLMDLPAPSPGPGEVAISVEACAVCRTDLHIVEGEVPARLPIVPGHQAAGRIAEIGPDVSGLAPGDAVGVGWMAGTCGLCDLCRSGRENLCARARFTGRDRDGGYAERMTADARWVYRLPSGMSPREAAPLLCAGVIGYRALRLSRTPPGGRLGLFGFGASAHLTLQTARAEGCGVYAFTRKSAHRDLAMELGAAWAGRPDEDPGVELDGAITFAPAGEIVPLALARLAAGATLAVNAIHMSPIPTFEYGLLYGERSLRSVANSTRRDAEEFLRRAAEIPIRASVEALPLEEANAALRRVARGEARGATVLIVDRQALSAPTPGAGAGHRPRRTPGL